LRERSAHPHHRRHDRFVAAPDRLDLGDRSDHRNSESLTTSHLVSTRSSIRDTKMLRSIGHHVGGQQFAGKGSRTQSVFNPATGEQTGVLSLASKADVDTAVEVAAKASRFADHHMHGPEGLRFYSRMKTVTSRWPTGIPAGAEFAMPTMR